MDDTKKWKNNTQAKLAMRKLLFLGGVTHFEKNLYMPAYIDVNVAEVILILLHGGKKNWYFNNVILPKHYYF